MLKGDKIKQSNGLQICIDWLSFTLLDSCTSETVISLLGYTLADFQLLPRGLNGYRSQLRHSVYPISIQFDGREDMGIHVDISGSALSDVVTHYRNKNTSVTPFGDDAYLTSSFDASVLADLFREISSCGCVTRLDLAIDDIGAKYFTLPCLSSILLADCFVSKFRKWKELVQREHGNVCIGHTIYLGSRTSSIMLRVYDKQLEQNEKLLRSGEPLIMHPWVRWELEVKEERALLLAQAIINGNSINELALGILSNYIRLVSNDNVIKYRCSSLPKWDRFLDGIKKYALYCPSEPKNLDDTKNWLMRQTASSLASVVIADGGSMEFLERLVLSGSQRLSSHHKELIDSAT